MGVGMRMMATRDVMICDVVICDGMYIIMRWDGMTMWDPVGGYLSPLERTRSALATLSLQPRARTEA